MRNKKVILGVAAALCLVTSPSFAAKTALSNSDLGGVNGKANAYTMGGDTSMSLWSSVDARSNIQFGLYQWSDDHSGDLSLHKGANDQSGVTSNVQANVVERANSLTWGWDSQNTLDNSGTVTLSGSELNMAYGVTAMGGF